MPPLKTLRVGAYLFVAAWIIHTSDHARRGLDASPNGVVWAGTFVGLLAAVAITLILVRHPTAPAIAAAVFPAIAIGVTASHFLPEWGELSDPLLVDSNTDAWSILAAGSEVVAALYLGFVALRVMTANRYAWRISASCWA